MTDERTQGDELVCVEATLSRDQWTIVFLLLNNSASMLPIPSHDAAHTIIETLESGYRLATSV